MPTTSARQAAANLDAAIRAGQAGAVRALHGVGQRITADVQATLSSPAFPGTEGGPPARRSGLLQASYGTQLGRDARGRFYTAIASTMPGAPVAVFQEFGTSTSAARPHLRPAVNRALPLITPEIKRGWEAGVRSAAKGR